MAKTVCLGMSGGVDSALAAALLVEQGFDVRAVYMRNWSRDLPGFRCRWADDLADAERVAVTLGIGLEVWDCEEEYRRTVVDYLVDAYARGLTPNPDVMCNQTVKFGTFAQRALAEGADYVATGHYARVGSQLGEGGAPSGVVAATSQAGAPASGVAAAMPQAGVPASGQAGMDGLGAASGLVAPARLFRAADEYKDQTYFLWRVPGEVLAHTLFPIGGYASKAEVRAACAERGLGVEAKPDSDGICFVGEVGIRSFLLDTLERRAGDVVEWETGRVLGRHDGAFLFTVGQRRGLDLGGGPARYVVSTDVERNVVYVSASLHCPGLWCRGLELSDVRWIAGLPPRAGRYLLRTRHTGELVEALVTPREPDVAHDLPWATVEFDEPRRTVAPGQSAVVYDGLECLGGGVVIRGPEGVPGWA